jgi:uncharacterized protein (DUF58 family)
VEQLLLALAIGTAAVIGLSVAPLSVTPRAGWLVALAAAAALVVSPTLALLVAVAVAAAFAVDAWAARRRPRVDRRVARVLARGVPTQLAIDATPVPGRLRVRQPPAPDVAIEPPESDGALVATVTARRRGRHALPPPASRHTGPLGLAAWYRTEGDAAEVLVYPDLPAARRLALAVRQGRFRAPGSVTRGPLGLGTEFESVRDYVPDDDVRQINWRATQRLARPMTNQFRVEQDRDVVCVLDCGRLMAAPVRDRTRLDAALDATAAVAYVADEVGDRAGVVAFTDRVERHLPPRRRGGEAVVHAVFDLEPQPLDADYELAFRTVGRGKRALVVVFTDLLDEAAATALLDAVPVLARRHAVVVASVRDPDLDDIVGTPPATAADVYSAVAALDVLDARARVQSRLRRMGADVLEAPPALLAAACVSAYLSAKRRARL